MHNPIIGPTFVSLFEKGPFYPVKPLIQVDSISYKTKNANKTSAEKNWVLVDAENQVLGRVASQ